MNGGKNVSVIAGRTYIKAHFPSQTDNLSNQTLSQFYPTVPTRVVIVPILSCIFGFPILVLLIICILRIRARKAREAEKRRLEHTLMEMHAGPAILVSQCTENKDSDALRPMLSERRKLKMPSIKFHSSIDSSDERSDYEVEATSSEVLHTPEESSGIFTSL